MTVDERPRCPWPSDELMLRYHDEEWGVPTHDERTLFEFLALEAAQAGLSWRTILHKRAAFVRAFDGFHPERVALMGDADIERMLQDPGIVRNRLKLRAIVHNAQRFVEVKGEFGSFGAYLWGFFGGALPRPDVLTGDMVPATTPESDALSADLKKRGFKFVGSTIVYAYMQSVGLVNDHVTGCFRAPPGSLS
ncbi:MAG: DNA-3-methyladenine glycosylase I [Chloroflexota bacterium]|nr:DNA-3-methyladenine glycosylase I [Chloroflexota bacterium]MDE2883474.1 DNA-3-methyladenine glycosylase I [Chloroflexota bacterium]